MRPVRGSLLAVAVLFAAAAAAAEEDPCRDRFVTCVAETGDPMACHAVSAACRTESIPKMATLEGLEQNVQLEQRDGQAYARLTIANTGEDAIDVSAISRDFRCPDGTTDTLYFIYQRRIEKAETLRSAKIIACYGQGAAEPAAQSLGQVAGLSAQSATFYCDSGQTRSVTVNALDDKRLVYRRSDGIGGMYRSERPDGLDLVNTACTDWGDRDDDVIAKLRRDAIKAVEDLLDAAGVEAGGGAGDGKTISTGPRN